MKVVDGDRKARRAAGREGRSGVSCPLRSTHPFCPPIALIYPLLGLPNFHPFSCPFPLVDARPV